MRDVSVVRGIGVLPIFAGLIGLAAAGRLARRDLGERRTLSTSFRAHDPIESRFG